MENKKQEMKIELLAAVRLQERKFVETNFPTIQFEENILNEAIFLCTYFEVILDSEEMLTLQYLLDLGDLSFSDLLTQSI